MRISDWSSDVCSSDLKFWNVGGGFIFSLSGEAGYIHSLEKQRYDSAGNEIDKVRLTDRFFLGEPQMRGFDIRGIGPRVLRYYLADSDGNGVYTREDSKADTDDALGGRIRSEEHTSELQQLMRITYAVFCLKKKHKKTHQQYMQQY